MIKSKQAAYRDLCEAREIVASMGRKVGKTAAEALISRVASRVAGVLFTLEDVGGAAELRIKKNLDKALQEWIGTDSMRVPLLNKAYELFAALICERTFDTVGVRDRYNRKNPDNQIRNKWLIPWYSDEEIRTVNKAVDTFTGLLLSKIEGVGLPKDPYGFIEDAANDIIHSRLRQAATVESMVS